MANEMLIVSIDEIGVVHFEGDKLIVGDLDIIAKAKRMAGLSRQRGRVEVNIFIRSGAETNVSPDMDGMFAEASEPPAGGGLG